MIKKIIKKYKDWRAEAQRKKAIEELKKRDPFIYK